MLPGVSGMNLRTGLIAAPERLHRLRYQWSRYGSSPTGVEPQVSGVGSIGIVPIGHVAY
jgi:hypothetical protein